MTATAPFDERDIQQNEYSDDAKALKVLMIGKTSGGVYVPVKVNDDGSIANS